MSGEGGAMRTAAVVDELVMSGSVVSATAAYVAVATGECSDGAYESVCTSSCYVNSDSLGTVVM